MKAKPLKPDPNGPGRIPCSPEEATEIWLCMPGCFYHRRIPVKSNGTDPHWQWNGDVDKPTLTPSILTWNADERCHSFVTDGKVRFLDDCTHEYAGQTMDLLEVD